MKDIERQIERDCAEQMVPCFVLHFLRELLTLAVPVVTSWMIGDMADALLALDLDRVKGRLAVFLLAFVMEVLVLKIVGLREDLELTRRGFRYGHQMFSRYLHLPMANARAIDAATLVQRVDSDTTDYYFVLMQKWTRPAVLGLYLAVLGGIFVLESFHPLFILTMAALSAVPILRAARNARQKAALRQAKLDYEERRKGMEYGLLSARDFLHGFGLSGRYIARAHRQFEAYSEKIAAPQDQLDGADEMFAYLCTYGVPSGVIAVGALLIAGGRMGVGALLAGHLIMPTLTRSYQFLEELILDLRQELMLRDRLKVFYAGEDQEGRACRPRELRLDRVTFSYPGGDGPVFREKSLTVPLSGQVQIAGANGAGKSTLLALLAGIYAPQAGTIADEAGHAFTCGDLRNVVSLQEQDGGLFSATVAENLFVPTEHLGKAERLLRRLGFALPLDAVLAEGGADLSPGERKKLLLVRALMKDAPVLALDEPLDHLDTEGAKALEALLREEERPILLVSHTPLRTLTWERIEL